jgi:ferrochelatase
MRHWEPRIAQAVSQIAADGVEKVVALVMAPHSSQMSSSVYFARLEQAIKEQNTSIRVMPIPSWHKHAGLIDAITKNAGDALAKFDDRNPYIVFTAHSLPSRILDQGDPYDTQLRETAVLVARRMGWPLGRFQFCYQSAGQSGEAWMGPPIEEVVLRLAKLGEKNLLVVPVGFVCDHVEVLYDIDIAARQLAASHGAHLERSDSLNDNPVFINALADLVESHILLAVD